jgi:predicted RNA-binding Zn ribbon-like protein
MSKRLRNGKRGTRGKYLKKVRHCPKPCGKEFKPRIRTQVHCSVKCRNRAAQMAYRERQRKAA